MPARISEIHAAYCPGVLVVTGGGSLAISDLLETPGASRTVLEALVPYCEPALAGFLRSPVEQACAARTARAMAMAAFWRAWQWLAPEDAAPDYEEVADARVRKMWGVGATASLRSDRPKRGEHRAHVAVQTAQLTHTFSLVLTKDARTRAEEERLVADLVLGAVRLGAGLPFTAPRLLPGERLEQVHTEATDDWRDVVLGRVDAVSQGGEEETADQPSNEELSLDVDDGDEHPSGDASHSGGVIFPGAFHPLHDGHRQIARLAEQHLGAPVEFEISVENVDKAPLDYTEIERRLEQFAPTQLVWLTRAPTFVEKARIFPGATFVVGADTAERIAAERYYGSAAERDAAIEELARLGCRLLVFPRLLGDRFQTLDDLSLPARLRALSTGIAATEFRADISSTDLRRHAAES